MTISTKDLTLNEQIQANEVRVNDENGAQLGIMPLSEARQMADERNLDLVLIAPQGKPPVCRIMDYGKYRFEQAKREKELKKNQKQIELKEIRMSLNIDTNDFNTKVGNAIKFLKNGDKVKVTIRFKGREMTHPKLGEALMRKVIETCAEYAISEKAPKFEGRNFATVLNPKTVAAKKHNENKGGQV
ncbi:MAG: translation initiation factor IF-3 [Oscillospiraceae bacterium]|nr:translation initiation factor IF-3 [Oscillospiraceae bacterium]